MPTSSEVNGSRTQSPSARSINSPSSLRRSNDELRKNISLLKRELEVERNKSKQTHRDKIAEIKKLRDKNDEEKKTAIDIMTEKLKLENEQEINKLKDILLKEKQSDIKQLLKFKDEELRVTKRLLHDEKQRALKDIEDRHRKYLTSLSLKEGVTEQERKLRRELIEARKQKQAIEEILKAKAVEDNESNEIIRRQKDESEQKLNQMNKDHKKETMRLVNELNSNQKVLHEKEQLLLQAESDLKTLEREKILLNDRLREQSSRAESLSVEFKKEKRLAAEKDPSIYQKQIKDLGRKNFELGMTIRRLEDKEKELKEQVASLRQSERKQSAKALEYSEMLTHLKKTFTMQRARLLSSHAKEMLDKTKEIKVLQEKEENQSVLNDSNENSSQLKEIIEQLQKENLRLEKQLASPKSSSSTPIKEDNNLMEGQSNSLKEENKLLKESIYGFEMSMEEMSRQLKELLEKEAEFNLIIGQKNDYCSLMLTQLEDAEKKLSDQMKVTQSEEEKCKNMENMLSAMQDEIIDVQSVLSKKKEQCLNLTSELKEEKARNYNLQMKMTKSDKADNDVKNLIKQNDDLIKSLKLKQSRLHELEIHLDDYEAAKEDLRSLQQQISTLEDCRIKSMEAAESRQNEIKKLQQEREQQKQFYEERLYALHNEMKELEARHQEIEADKRTLLEELHAIKLKASRQPTMERSVQTDHNTEAKVSPDSLSPPTGESRDADIPLAAEYLQSSSLHDSADSNSSSGTLNFTSPSLKTEDIDKRKDVTDSSSTSTKVDPPSSVILERRLTDSILLRWNLPTRYPADDRIKGFVVYQNGGFKQLALGAKRTNALVTDLDFNTPSSFAIRTVTGSGLISRDSNLVLLSSTGSYTERSSRNIEENSRSKHEEAEDENETHLTNITSRSSDVQSSNRIEISDDLDLSAIIEETAEELHEYEAQLVPVDEMSDTDSSDILEIMHQSPIKNTDKNLSETRAIDHDIIDEVPDFPHDDVADGRNSPKLDPITPRSVGTDIEEDSIESECKIPATDSVSSEMKVSSLSSFYFTDDDEQASDKDLDSIDDNEAPLQSSKPKEKPSESVAALTKTISNKEDAKQNNVIDEASSHEETKTQLQPMIKPRTELESVEKPDSEMKSIKCFESNVEPFEDQEPPIEIESDIKSNTKKEYVQDSVAESEFFKESVKEPPAKLESVKEPDVESVKRPGVEIESVKEPINSKHSHDRSAEIRIFIALFSYDPNTMSPNDDGCDTELDFREGDLIKIFGDVDSDGFYLGEINGKEGLVPSNMIQEVDLDLIQSSKESTPRRSHNVSASSDAINDSLGSNIEQYKPLRKTMVALYDYDPSISSPNVDAEVELAFNAGDILYVYGEMDEDGFYAGERQGQKGLVPSNFLQETSQETTNNDELLVGYRNDKKQFSSMLSSSAISSTSSPKDKRKKRFYHAGKKLLAKLKRK